MDRTASDAATISSLYGPGTIGCWLCALLSIIVSWKFNVTVRSKDTLPNDFIAALLLPAIAGIHLVCEVASHTVRSETSKALPPPVDSMHKLEGTSTISATLVICETYTIVAPGLMALAVSWGNFKRFFCLLVVTGICSSGTFLLISHTSLYKDLRPLAFAYIWAIIFLFLLIFLLFIPFVHGIRRSFMSLIFHFATPFNDFPRPTVNAEYLWSIYFYYLAQSFIRGLGRIKGAASPGALFLIPTTPYSLHDLDQAVALAGGLVTLILGVHDIVKKHYPWFMSPPLGHGRPSEYQSSYSRGGMLHPDTVWDDQSLLLRRLDYDHSVSGLPGRSKPR
ncbi:hypothetical protein K491DRAFT_282244 [Lophiostoma macrostomum CBS 122681]|uniref:Uncharacterized protein n=1 Tax=Lophiostoma macrostomum CBS 122681 TaxID=1314788 RepID=A0A6A6TS71_9PLEO|nr:hypothetical protein K491DRAFT_282244 [Lophiostoma macrostomum CBS 122681]